MILTLASSLTAAEIPIKSQPKIVSNSYLVEGIATDGRTFLLLNAFVCCFGGYADYGFVGRIVNPDGTALTVPVTGAAFIAQGAAVTSSGSQYLVVTNDSRFGVHGIRVSSRGEVLDSTPFLIAGITTGGPPSGQISVAWDGTRYVVIWHRPEGPLGYAYVSEEGRVEATGSVQGAGIGTVAARNGVSLIVTKEADGIFLRTLTTSGISEPIALTTNRLTGSVVVAGADDFLAMWTNNGTVFAQRLDNTGKLIGGPFPLPIANPTSFAATWDGTSYVIVWSDENKTRALRLMLSGSTSDPVDVAIDSDSYVAGIVSAAGRIEVVLRNSSAVTLKSIDSSNIVSPPASEPGAFAFPAIVSQNNVHAIFNGVDYIVFWEDIDGIRFSRIKTNGQHLDGDGVFLAQGRLLDVAEGSGLTLVLWNQSLSPTSAILHAARIDPSGTILDVPPLQLDSAYAIRARAIWNGSQFVVFWAPATLSTMPLRGTLAVRIKPDGSIVDTPPRQVFPTPLYFEVARNKDRYQIAYDGGQKVEVFAVTSDLQLATGSGTLSLPTEKVESFSISSNGDDFFVVWNNEAEEVVGQRTSWNADSIGPRIVYSNNKNRKGRPHITFDGSEYAVVWPEADDGEFSFNMRHADRDVAEVVGPVRTIATGPVIGNGDYLPFLTDWAYVPGAIPAVAYGRTDQVDGLLWGERLFLQEAFSSRHRVATH